MTTLIANSTTDPSPDTANKMELPGSPQVARKFWIDTKSLNVPDVLDPDDSLMTKFQNALREHLIRVDNKLNSEILELEANIKALEKERETEALQLYYAQQEIAQQQKTIEKCQSMIANVVSQREEKDTHVKNAKEVHRNTHVKLLEEKRKEENLMHELEQTTDLQAQFSKLQTELENALIISKQVSKKDKIIQRDLIAQKQQKDCIIYKLMEEVWRIKNEITNLDTQLQLKNKEKIQFNQMIADVNTDLETLHKQHTNLCNAWNSVVLNITNRNKVYEQLNTEREKICESFNTLQTEIDKLKKETCKETENNENLTLLHTRIQDNILNNTKLMEIGNDKLNNLESELVKIAKFSEQEQHEFDLAQNEWQYLLHEEEEIDKEFTKCLNKQNELEKILYSKLEEKVAHNKTAQYLNKLLLNSKESMQEQELLLAETENSYSKQLLELEQLNLNISYEKMDFEELLQNNKKKEKEIDEVQKEIKKHDTAIERTQLKIISLKKTIEEILSHRENGEIDSLDLKIITLEKNIEEIQQNNQKAQQLWIRQEGYMITLSQQKDLQLQELNLLNKEIMIMEQKNLKLEHASKILDKEDSNMERTLNLLQQKIVQINSQLVIQKGLKEELEDKNSIRKMEGIQALEDAELSLIKMQSDLKQLYEEKALLKDNLDAVQQESLSWEKKVKLMQETMKKMKDERSDGGDITVMKSEIHKMEMRLSHLRKVQEKLIHDMEFCVARREIILDKVMSKFKKDPKGQHNQKVIFRKRLADQKLKIKQIVKDTKKIENRILELENQVKDAVDKCNESQTTLKIVQNDIPNLDQGITQTEAVKHHNLQALVFKQRKAKMLQDIKSSRYKMLFKSEATLNEEFQNEQILRDYLKHVMERTNQDFPLLKNDIQKIFLTLEIS
ncbi:Coiled-coil domain-containing protein 40 [Trachymyrmex septentrionalis]|uniref:Coiled-coil domain-containing protein 40 n=1 Tax=Trachymyrmex septentrionalis TaxID=34720 RepID=A0A195ERJ0_9HYME|nr:PREDICTED: coiled-coil domain-containing protein 40 [Trachymyrmex septentrionalis]KYN30494.1 Coiled-coil domain-containing protein 40 [Trachymyrmex septentrionalis]